MKERIPEHNRNRVIFILLIFIVILLGALTYTLVFRPRFSGYIIDAQNDAYEFAISQIVEQASDCQEVSLLYEDQTVTLVSVDCLS